MTTRYYTTCLVLTVAGGSMMAADAATVAPSASTAQHHFSIPKGSDLSTALLTLGQQSGLQLVFDATLAKGMVSDGLTGDYTTNDALNLLLLGSSLSYKYLNNSTIQIFSTASSSADGSQQLGTVTVDGSDDSGAQSAFASVGVNGSSDVTATEGSGSLNGSLLTIGSKGATSVKETPQSVSVISQQAMKQQNIQNLNDAMNRATGVTTQQGSDNRSETFWSRGYQITNMQIDGGSPINIGGSAMTNNRFQPSFDMSMYDHVEILRGADGLFNGNGSSGPGGSVNLVRKRPLDHYQTIYSGSVGSWRNYRNMLDVTGPLGFDGKLRGRGVLTWQNNHYFYQTAHDDNKIAYGTLEADLTPTTLLTVGGSYTRYRGTPWDGGLEVFQDGSNPHLPRNTAWTYPWERSESDTKEVFASLEQKLGENWDAKLNYTHLGQQNYQVTANPIGTIPLDGSDSGLYSAANRSKSTQDSLDFTLNGQVEVFGLPQKVTLGSNWSHMNSYVTSPGVGDGSIMPSDFLTNLLRWDNSVPEPSLPSSLYAYKNSDEMTQWGAYARFEITPWKPLHLIYGLRMNSYQTKSLYNNEGYDDDGNSYVYPSATNDKNHSFESPYYAVSFDLNNSWTWYGSYTSIYVPQLSYIGLNGSPIQPITGNNYETGLKYARPDGMLNASLALYRIEENGMQQQLYHTDPETGDTEAYYVDLGGGRSGYYKNSSASDISQGIDLEITGALTPWWQTTLGYTYNDNKQGAAEGDDEGKPLQTFSPKHLVKWWNDFQFKNDGEMLSRFQFGAGVQAQSSTYVTGDYCNEDYSSCNSFNFKSGFYATFSARIAYQINKDWDVALRADNLLDRTYYQTVGDVHGNFWYGEPRNYMLTLTGTFH